MPVTGTEALSELPTVTGTVTQAGSVTQRLLLKIPVAGGMSAHGPSLGLRRTRPRRIRFANAAAALPESLGGPTRYGHLWPSGDLNDSIRREQGGDESRTRSAVRRNAWFGFEVPIRFDAQGAERLQNRRRIFVRRTQA